MISAVQQNTKSNPEVKNIWTNIMITKIEEDKKREQKRKEEELIKFRMYLYSIGKYDLEAGAVLE
jgi:hypothetical protein